MNKPGVLAIAAIGSTYLFGKLGLAGNLELQLCPHEMKTLVVSHGIVNTFSYRPQDCYMNVRGNTIRPIVATSSEHNCCGFGDECMSNY